MKNVVSIIIIVVYLLILGFLLFTRNEEDIVSKTYEPVEVTIIGEKKQTGTMIPMRIGDITVFTKHSDVYKIIVEYNGEQYVLKGDEIYHKYKNKIGETVIGTLEALTYKDGSVRYNIVELE